VGAFDGSTKAARESFGIIIRKGPSNRKEFPQSPACWISSLRPKFPAAEFAVEDSNKLNFTRLCDNVDPVRPDGHCMPSSCHCADFADRDAALDLTSDTSKPHIPRGLWRSKARSGQLSSIPEFCGDDVSQELPTFQPYSSARW